MAFSIGPIGNQNQRTENPYGFNHKNSSQSVPPEQQLQQLMQQLSQMTQMGQNQNQNQNMGQGLQGPSQDSMVSFSPEAMESLAAQGMQQQGQQGPGGANPAQLEQQIQSGDLQSALSTIEQMDASHPGAGNGPNQGLKTQLKEQLQQGDQAGAEQTLQQMKASRPPGPPPGQAQQQGR